MPNRQDGHQVALFIVADDVRPYDRQLARGIRSGSPSTREMLQAVARLEKRLRERPGGLGLVGGDHVLDRFEILKRLVRPDDFSQGFSRALGPGRGRRWPIFEATPLPDHGA